MIVRELSSNRNVVHGHVSAEKYIQVAMLSFAWIVYLFSPSVALCFSLLIMCLFSEWMETTFRRLFGFSAVIAMATCVASRAYGLSPSDDFIDYYKVFLGIAGGDWNYLFSFGHGLEVGLPLLWIVVSFFNAKATIPESIFIIAFLANSLFLIWLEIYGVKSFEEKKRGAVVAFSLLMCSFIMSSQLTRQFLASLFVLFALSNSTRVWRMFLLLIAMSFHLSSLPVYLLIFFLRRTGWGGVILVGGIGFASVHVIGPLAQIDFLNILGSYKLNYFVSRAGNFAQIDLDALKYFSLVAVASIVSVFTGKGREHYEVKLWMKTFWGFYLLFIAFLPLHSFSCRFTFLMSGILRGWLFSLFVNRVDWRVIQIAFIVLLVWRSREFFSLIDTSLWEQFDWYGWFPGYFMK